MKILKIREFILVVTVAGSMWWIIPGVFGQPTDRDWERVERQVDKLMESRGAESISIERRLSQIEGAQSVMNQKIDNTNQKMDDAKRLAMGALAVLVGLAIQAFWGIIVTKRTASNGN